MKYIFRRLITFFVVGIMLLQPLASVLAAEESTTPIADESIDIQPTSEIAPVEVAPITDKSSDTESIDVSQTPDSMQAMSSEDAPYKDDKKAVGGKWKAEADTMSGALLYTYPIDIPQGRNGMQPDLKLMYNSQSNDIMSPFGAGWSVNIPYIERVNKRGIEKMYIDNNFSSSMSGEIVASSTSAQYYGAKVDNGEFLKYQFSGGQYWIATDKNGITYKFGQVSTSRQDDFASSTRVYKWMLDEMQDANGNKIKYEYYKESGQVYPYKIKYTGFGGDDGIFEVEFIRESRSDSSFSYNMGFGFRSNYRIKEINAKINSIWTKKYGLNYTVGDNGAKSLISSIVESGQDEQNNVSSLPASFFTYQHKQGSWATTTDFSLPVDFLDSLGYDTGARLADVNGDGLVDILHYSDYQSPTTYINTGSGWTASSTWNSPVRFIGYRGADVGVRIADANGDGLPDIIQGGYTTKTMYLNNGNGWTASTTWAFPFDFGLNVGFIASQGVVLSDVNSDGLVDIIKVDSSNRKVYINNGSGWVSDNNWVIPNEIFMYPSGHQIIDVNGDGLVDIVRGISNDYTHRHVYLNKGDGTGWYETGYPSPGNYDSENGDRLEDLNGDGLVDWARVPNGNRDRQIYMNQGVLNWNLDYSWNTPIGFAYGSSDDGAYFVDINGDGLVDVIQSKAGTRGSWLAKPAKADLLSKVTTPTGASYSFGYQETPLYTASSTLSNPKLQTPITTVKNIVVNDNNGNIGTTTYGYFGGEVYYNNPFDHKFAGFSRVETTDPAGNITKTYYHQGNGTASATGEYDDHFSKIGRAYRSESYDNAGNLFTKTISKWDKYALGDNRYFVKLSQSVASTYDGDTDHRDKAQSFNYDNTNGNVLSIQDWGEVSSNDDGTFTDTGTDLASTSMSYVINPPNYLYALPVVTTTYDQSANKVKETRYYYDNQSLGSVTNGNLTKQEDWVSGTGYVDNEKTYNSYGQVTQEKDPRDKATNYTYDSYNLYPATTTNAISQTASFVYDYSLGKPKQVTDANGLVYQTVYDGLDRIIEEKQPDITSPSTLVTKATYYYFESTSSPRYVQQINYLSATSSVDSYIYLDGLDRKIQTRSRADSTNTYSVNDSIYNNSGQLDKESLPYFSTGTSLTSATANSALYSRYSYDAMGRVTTIANVVGTTTNAYDDWKVTTTDAAGHTKDLYSDVRGNLVRVDEHNATSTYSTYYEYSLLGNLTKITDALSNIRNFTYDGLGRQLYMEDLHAAADTTFGTTTSGYDDAGNLTSRQDPKGQVVYYAYDDINRPLTENYAGQSGTEVSYGYDYCSYGKGKMCSATTTDAVKQYDYNALGGVNTEKQIIASTTYTTTYNYDRQGNITSLVYPDNTVVRNTYNNAGQLSQVDKKETDDVDYVSVLNETRYNPLGQIEYQRYNNSASTTNVYDQNNLYRLTNKQTTNASTTKLQSISYTYDQIGNITRIVDASNSNSAKTTDYTYDDLSRLTSASTTNAVNGQNYKQTYGYSAIGNILSKSDIGNYAYTGNQGSNYANPHAVTNVAGNNYTYDNNGNLTNDSNWSHSWDYNNRLVQSVKGTSTVLYSYDQSGQRVKKTENGKTTSYINNYYEVDGTGTIRKHIFAGDAQIATIENSLSVTGCTPPTSGDWTISTSCSMNESYRSPASVIVNASTTLTIASSSILEIDLKNNRLLIKQNGGVLIKKGGTVRQTTSTQFNNPVTNKIVYNSSDHLSGASVETDENGQPIEILDYFPFGSTRINDKTSSYDSPEKYTGKKLDSETNLYYYGARYYNSDIGRWTSQDAAFNAVGDADELKNITGLELREYLSNPQFLNSYSYSNNNPIVYRDADGNFIFLLVGYAVYTAPIWVPAIITTTALVTASVASWHTGAAIGHLMEGDTKASKAESNKTQAALATGAAVITGTMVAGEMLGAGGAKTDVKLNQSKQDKHIQGSNNYQEGKSILTHKNPNELLKKSGTGQSLNKVKIGQPGSKERVDFGKEIGIYKSADGKTQAKTSVGIIHQSKKGAHIVPAKPKSSK